MTYIIFILYIICSALGMVLIKLGGQNTQIRLSHLGLQFQFSWLFFLGAFLYILSFLLWMYILQRFSLTYISPLAYGIMFVVMAILSYFILNETMSGLQILGLILILGGVLISSIS